MCGGLVVLSPGSPSQVLCAVLIMLLHMLVVLRTSPFLRDSEDVSSFISSLGLTLMYLGALVKMLQKANGESDAKADLLYVGVLLDVLPILCIGAVLGIMIVMDCGVCNVCLCACSSREKSSENASSVGATRVTPLNGKKNQKGSNKASVEEAEQLRLVRLEYGASSIEYKRALQQHSLVYTK